MPPNSRKDRTGERKGPSEKMACTHVSAKSEGLQDSMVREDRKYVTWTPVNL